MVLHGLLNELFFLFINDSIDQLMPFMVMVVEAKLLIIVLLSQEIRLKSITGFSSV